jgi:hypothetical protein
LFQALLPFLRIPDGADHLGKYDLLSAIIHAPLCQPAVMFGAQVVFPG